MRSHRRHDPIAIPLGHVEQARTVGVVVPDAVPHDPDPRYLRPVSFAHLNTPTVTRRAAEARAPRWEDEPEDVRAEAKQAAIEQLTFKLQTARRVLVANPGLELAEHIDRLERALVAVEKNW